MNKIFILPSAPNILKIYNKKMLVTGGVSNKGNGFMNNMFHCPHISFARDLTKSGFWQVGFADWQTLAAFQGIADMSEKENEK